MGTGLSDIACKKLQPQLCYRSKKGDLKTAVAVLFIVFLPETEDIYKRKHGYFCLLWKLFFFFFFVFPTGL